MQDNKKVQALISSRVSLAPMAGITDYVLRSLVREYSPNCLLTTEMISSEALTQVKDTDIVARGENHSPISYQLSGHKPKMIAECANYLQKYADMIDINMGCPVNKVVKGTDGCALMRNVELAQEIVRTTKANISIPLSVKFRLGYTFDELNFVEYGQKMQEAGADFITIHGRTRSQMYGGKADWKKIAELKRNVDLPVFANGDVVSIETAVQCLEESGADGAGTGRPFRRRRARGSRRAGIPAGRGAQDGERRHELRVRRGRHRRRYACFPRHQSVGAGGRAGCAQDRASAHAGRSQRSVEPRAPLADLPRPPRLRRAQARL